MRILGLEISRASREKALSSIDSGRGWISLIRESFAGAWQQNVTVDFNTVVSHHAVFSCMTRIARDVAKLRVKLVQRDQDGIWAEVENSAYSPVIRKPNLYQTRIQFFEHWVLSKLARGNTYVLKERDGRGVVSRLHILDPLLCRPLVADNGVDIFYELQPDNMAGIRERIIVPAREVIHDRMNCLFHPLVGISPIYASGLAATQGLNIQTDATNFFGNRSMPGGVLTAPGEITKDQAERLKAEWSTRFSGENAGKTAILGDGLKFEPMRITAHDAQVIEQLKWTAEMVCSTFHVPPYKIGIGNMPTNNNVQALNVEYYTQAIQPMIEDIELVLDEGLGMGVNIGTEFDLDGLLRMDTKTLMEVVEKGVTSGTWKPNEGRAKFDLRPVDGGDTPYLQQQNFSLAALAERDRNKPFAKPEAPPPAQDAAADQTDRAVLRLVSKAPGRLDYARR